MDTESTSTNIDTNLKSYFKKDASELVIRSLFSKYKTDKSNVLEKPEILYLLKQDMGMSNHEADTCYMLIDKDGNGQVCFKEFLEWFRNEDALKNIDDKSRYSRIQVAIECFRAYDKDNSGTIDREEFAQFIGSIGYPGVIDEVLAILDHDGNGVISFPEFLAWVSKQWLISMHMICNQENKIIFIKLLELLKTW